MRIYIFLLTLTFSNLTFAQDFLEPERSFYSWGGSFSDYETNLIKAFSEVYDEGFIVRLFVFPSFQPEYAIALKKIDKEYKLVKLHLEEQYWPSYLDREFDNINIVRKEKTIDTKIAEGIISVWEEMLLRTKYRDYREDQLVGLDGTNYHFSMKSPVRFSKALSGRIWSPSKDSHTGMLVDISYDMVAFVDNDDTEILKRLEEKITKLNEILSKRIIIVPAFPILKTPR